MDKLVYLGLGAAALWWGKKLWVNRSYAMEERQFLADAEAQHGPRAAWPAVTRERVYQTWAQYVEASGLKVPRSMR